MNFDPGEDMGPILSVTGSSIGEEPQPKVNKKHYTKEK
jgi:hypothetical protein